MKTMNYILFAGVPNSGDWNTQGNTYIEIWY